VGGRSKTISRGVRIRTYPSGLSRIEIQFQYRGVTCKEILSNVDPSKASGRKFAVGLKAEVENAISRNSFDYANFFPRSRRANVFGQSGATLTVSKAQETLIADLARAGLEKTTLASYERSAKRINKHLGKVLVTELQPMDIRDMVRARKASRKTWNNDLIPLRRSLKRAVNDALILFSPLDRVELGELVPRHQKPKPDPFNTLEINAILAAAADSSPRAHNLLEFAFFTGLRLEELAALQWSNVDFNAGTVTITAAAQLSIKSAELKSPKTEAGQRSFDLLPRALSALKRQHTITRFKGLNVFCRWYSLKPFITYDQFNIRWKAIVASSGVRYRPQNQTRHTFASHQLSSGVNQLLVAQQLGHSGTALLDVYSTWVKDWRDEHKQRQYGY
jgi:integrase